MKIVCMCDGAAIPNPGRGGIGVVIKETGSKETIKEISEAVGEGTNNEAEYKAIIRALKEVRELKIDPKILTIMSDSELVINQLNGSYRIKQGNLEELAREVRGLMRNFRKVYFTWLPRERNKKADRLSLRAVLGKDADVRIYQENMHELIARGIEVFPLSVFRRREWKGLTISEAVVLELVERRGMSFKQVAKELDRKYTTVHTTYHRAKKKIEDKGK